MPGRPLNMLEGTTTSVPPMDNTRVPSSGLTNITQTNHENGHCCGSKLSNPIVAQVLIGFMCIVLVLLGILVGKVI
ncbi:hypothetical protein SASPL_101706 [Salvia splendens]|uniref:Uncharacterized protein n=1 Tax=Salvia splendens TaxID=180675 RepID=A0A8X8YRA8_SALSN|nr:hypothetical protein SASPL_101706 [Salvia splendens]